MIKKSHKKLFGQPPLMFIVVLALLLGVSGWYGYSRFHNRDITTGGTVTNPAGTEKINLNPPTEEEKNPAQDNQVKPPLVSTPEGTKNQVTPTITSADTNGARALVTGVNEDGGTCTATFKSSQGNVTATSTGFSNVSYTSCKPMALTTPLPRGTWIVTVSYNSPASRGESEPLTFKVP